MFARIGAVLNIIGPFPLLFAPHAEDNGHEERLREGVAGMNGVEHPGHFLMKDGAHQQHGLKPEPQPESELQRNLPVGDAKKHDKVREHKGDDEVLNKLAEQLAYRRFPAAMAAELMPRTSI